MDAGNQLVISSAGEVTNRQALVDNCVARAQGNSAFATALDSLLLPETGVSLADTPAAIIGNTNSPLYGSPTMQTLLALSAASGDGSLTVSSNLLMNLFTNETQIIWDTINTNLAVLAAFNQSQPDFLAYLTNQAAIAANVQLQAAVHQRQPGQIASATAAVLVQSQLMPDNALSTQTEQIVSAVGEVGIGIGLLCAGEPEGAEPLLSGGIDAFNLLSGTPSPQDAIVQQIANLQTLVENLSANVNYRFDRVDQSLTTIFDTLNAQFAQIDIVEGGITNILTDVDVIRSDLVNVQATLDSLEREIFNDQIVNTRKPLISAMNNYLFWDSQNPNTPMCYDTGCSFPYLVGEAEFYSYATGDAQNAPCSPSGFTSADFTGSAMQQQLAGTNTLDFNLNYIQEFLSTILGQATAAPTPPAYLSNPRDWFMAAYSYLELAKENPMFYRFKGPRLPAVISAGQDLTNFFASLTFTNNTGFNWPLYAALGNFYYTNLTPFLNQVSATEQQYASANYFALGTWRQWDAAAPRVTNTTTEMLGAPTPSIIVPRQSATSVAAGGYHSLALEANGTLLAWGDNSSGQTTIPASASNLVAIAAGYEHSLALMPDGSVVGWGDNSLGQTNCPAGLNSAVAIAAGGAHSLALRNNGTVVGWGDNSSGQTNSPTGLTNVVAIAAGAAHSLALQANGTVVGWGAGGPGTPAYGLSFNGTNAYVALPPATWFSNQFTIEAWVYERSYNNWSVVINCGNSGEVDSVYLGLSYGTSGQPLLDVFRGTSPQDVAAPQPLPLNQWVHLAATLTNNTATLYVNGVAVSSGTVTAPNALNRTNNYIGTPNLSFAYYANAIFDELRVWNVARTGASIRANLLHPLTGAEAGLLAYYRLNQNAGTTATNGAATGAAYNGTLNGPTWVTGWSDFGQATIPAQATNVTMIAAGAWHSLALRTNGTVVGWGYNSCGQTNIPAGLTNVVAIAAGYQHSLALKADGTLVAWGDNSCGQTNIPAGLTNIVAIAAGSYHSLALKTDGTVVAWGRIYERQCLVPPALTWRGAIAASDGGNCLALKADGTLVAWGDNSSGEAAIPASATNVVAIAAGEGYNLALKADGTLVVWGDNTYGQTNVPASLTNLVAIAAGDGNCLALKADSTVVAWGYNNDGQANVPTSLTNVVAVAAGGSDSLALRADGTVVGWGWSFYGQTNTTGLTNVVAIAEGYSHCLALKADGTLVAWGSTYDNEITIPASATNVVAIAAGDSHSLALKANGTVVGWGDNDDGETNTTGLTNVVAIAAGGLFSVALKADGTVLAWGDNAYNENTIPSGLTNVVAIAAGDCDGLALRADGTVVGWGRGGPGVSGYLDYGQTTIPTGLTNVVAIAAGAYHTLALKADSTVVAWGANSYNETNTTGLTNVAAIAAGYDFSLALKGDGTVVGWGDDYYGQANTTALTNVVAIAAGAYHGLALKADGTVAAWGDNSLGETNIPAGLTNVVAIAAGDDNSLFLTVTQTAGSAGSVGLVFVGAQIPVRIPNLLLGDNNYLLTQLAPGQALYNTCLALSGAKLLLADVLELGMPYTLERDGVLHGFLYGSESLADNGSANTFLQAQITLLQAMPNAAPQALTDVAALRCQCFTNHLNQCLTNLAATGQPEIMRLVGHTLRLLNLLSDMYSYVPPPALEIWSQSNSPSLLLYGEPYVNYTLQYRGALSVPGWTTTIITNLLDEQTITPPVSGPSRFYRVSGPPPPPP